MTTPPDPHTGTTAWTLRVLDEPDYLDGIQSKYDILGDSEGVGPVIAYAFELDAARLIAAAPALLEAVQRAIRHAINIGVDDPGSSYFAQLTAALRLALPQGDGGEGHG